MKKIIWTLLLLCSITALKAQRPVAPGKCATDLLLQKVLSKNPAAKKQYQQSEKMLSNAMLNRHAVKMQAAREMAIINIPVVFHVVLSNPAIVTDAIIQQQLDILNADFSGLNADSTKIPAAFKPLYGKSSIRFCMARRTPDGEPTNGIERISSSTSSIPSVGDPVKHKNSGGLDAWNAANYLNIWITTIPNGILGYALIPGIDLFPADEDGVVIHYNSLPVIGTAPYNLGRTAVHEAGHYFRLLHIWGDDGGACTGSDFPDTPLLDDTPNQANSTGGCPIGVITDACSNTAPGILYQDFMDYTNDACMVMFTNGQATRMEATINALRPTLLTSNGCILPVLKNRNISSKKILNPVTTICADNFTPSIAVKNIGTDNVTTLTITVTVDGVVKSTTNFTGNIASLADQVINLNPVNGISTGNHQLVIYTSSPNGQADEDVTNDTLKSTIVFPAILQNQVKEGFETNTFPPVNWAVSNPDNSFTWERTTLAAKTGNASVLIRNFDYIANGERDQLISPLFNVQNVDSTFLTFQLAAATYTAPGTIGNTFDTLEILLSRDCGQTFTSVYKKWGTNLVTRADKVNGLEEFFIPSVSEWRKDSVYLTPYLTNASTVQLLFKNTTNWENNIYLDDINLYNIVINPNLKAKGLLVTPNPFVENVIIQHYPNPTKLKNIVVVNSVGQIILQRNFAVGTAPNYIDINLAGKQSGIYFIKLFYTDQTITQKVLKLNN